MGNVKGLKLDERSETTPHAGKTCLKFEYRDKEGWAGIVWQDPPNDWGTRPGGWDLSGARRLTFWARGEQGGETISCEFGLLGPDKPFHDSAKGKLEHIKLSTEWQRFGIDLAGRDLSRIKSGFVVTVAAKGGPVTFYLDDIGYE
jgi:hypothetical protein